jgi:hypothetical protein
MRFLNLVGLAWSAGIAWALTGVPFDALAQSQARPPNPPSSVTPPPAEVNRGPFTAGTVRFESKPFRVESMGLTIELPLGSQASASSIANQSAVQIIGPQSRWLAASRILESSDLKLTIQQVVDANLRTQIGSDTAIVGETGPNGAQLIERSQNLVIGTLPAERFYVLGTANTGTKDEKKPRLVYGLTFIKLGPGRFASFEASCGEADFDKAKPELEAMIATAKFADAASLESSRRAYLDAGAKFLQSIDDKALRKALAESGEVWWRIYKPEKTGADADARELGYRRLRASIGKRGMIDPGRDPKTYSGADLDEGYVLQVDFRGILGENGDILTDSQGVFFLSLDRTQEVWTLSTRVREGKKKDTTSNEFGQRIGNRLVVRKGEGRATDLVLPPTAYISRVEAMLLHKLLVGSRLTSEFAFQSYSSETQLIEMRRDSVEQPADKPNIYRITTRMGETGPAQIATLKANGDLLFADMGDGVRIEPTTLDKLVRLWKTKGLPMD